jgi:ribosomal protein S18 acetylase RimI-like enzyme
VVHPASQPASSLVASAPRAIRGVARRPTFGSVPLAARIERVECGLLEGGVAAAQARDPGAGFFARPVGGGVATWCGERSPLNKVAGLGFGGPLDESALEEIERAFRARGAAVQVELSNLGTPEIARQLTRRGYALAGFENVLGLALPADRGGTAGGGIDVAPASSADDDVWLDAVVEGFATPDDQGVASHEEFPRDVLARTMRDLATVAGFVRYLARREGVVAGGASLRLADGVAQLAGAATRPGHRRRGVQTALLARRLADAAAAGCEIAVVTTQPGSKSQENVQRQGFDLLYTRAVLVRE